MDQCQHCLEYHIPDKVCDEYIEAVRKGRVTVAKLRIVYHEGIGWVPKSAYDDAMALLSKMSEVVGTHAALGQEKCIALMDQYKKITDNTEVKPAGEK